jgi:hypothetical protein
MYEHLKQPVLSTRKILKRVALHWSAAKTFASFLRSVFRLFSDGSDYLVMRKSLLTSLVAGAALVGIAGCAQIKKPVPQARAVPTGLRFDQVGSVTLFPGEPCTPQIMFNFRSAGSTVWLGAPKRETKVLTEAAKSKQRVHISGKWRRGGQPNCSYVEVTTAEVTR